MSDKRQGALILTQECFEQEDPHFLSELNKLTSPKAMASFADLWKRDPRPWAREQLFLYLDQPLNNPGHHPIIKRIFKYAEEKEDHELLAMFMVTFDRSVRRKRKFKTIYDNENQQWIRREILVTPRNSIKADRKRIIRDPFTNKKIEVLIRIHPESRLFSTHTRRYLARRAWRYFRLLGHRSPDQYIPAICFALKKYRDSDFASGENILDNWGLTHALFFGHEAVYFMSHQAALKEGFSIQDLTPAPYFQDLWEKPEAFEYLFSLVMESASKLVRGWAIQGLKQWFPERLAHPRASDLLALFDHEGQDAQDFAAEILTSSSDLEKLKVDTWLRLTGTKNPNSLAIICDLMKRHVSGDRLSLDQMIDLAISSAAPVSKLGLSFLKEAKIKGEQDRKRLSRLAHARCLAHGEEIAGFALSFYRDDDTYELETISDFFDSMLATVRSGAWQWMRECDRAKWDPILWLRLLETPYPDLRAMIIKEMERAGGIGPQILTPQNMERVWIETLMDIKRGAKRRPSILRKMADEIKTDRDKADRFLPLILFSARSTRAPEKRVGLSALVSLAESDPEIADKIMAIAPELRLNNNGGGK